ncbi:neutral zinc metallopeptidase, partial [Pseudanabaena galeata UHCC 0370]
MKWDEMRESDNVEDQRDGSDESTEPTNLSSSSVGMLGGLGAGGIAIAVIAGLIFKIDPTQLLNLIGGNNKPAPAPQALVKTPTKDRDSAFVKSVLGDTEDTWERIFKQQLKTNYQAPKLVLFDGSVKSACGSAKTSSGPFYCPADKKVYLDIREFDIAICVVRSTTQMAKNGKNRLAILTIFRFCRTGVKLERG